MEKLGAGSSDFLLVLLFMSVSQNTGTPQTTQAVVCCSLDFVMPFTVLVQFTSRYDFSDHGL